MVVCASKEEWLARKKGFEAACNGSGETFMDVKPIAAEFTDGQSTKPYARRWGNKHFILFATHEPVTTHGVEVHRFNDMSTGGFVDALGHYSWDDLMSQVCSTHNHATV